MRKRIGVVSIRPSISSRRDIDFHDFHASFGRNTGNYMFTQAMYRQFDADMVQVGFSFSPEQVNKELDHLVIPAANWLSGSADWDRLSDRLEQTNVPITMIGLGVQSDASHVESVVISESALRLVRLVASRSRLVSVRGDFSRAWLRYIGIDNVVTTGCPSLYMHVASWQRSADASGVVIQSTRYGRLESFARRDDVNSRLYWLAGKLGAYMVYQSESDEIEFLAYGQGAKRMDLPAAQALPSLYGLDDLRQLKGFLESKGRVFFDVDEWARFFCGTFGVIGTRLHGSILALNAGVPALLVPHDSRTREMAEFAMIPTLDQSSVGRGMTLDDLRDLLSKADVQSYYDARVRNSRIYADFLSECGLPIRPGALLGLT